MHRVYLAWLLVLPLMTLGQKRWCVATWNVENMFDVQHDTLHSDQEFLPDGERRWTPFRYWTKLNAVAQVITAMGEDDFPLLVGLQEVENDTVMRDLTERSLLRGAGYKYVMTDGPDHRGVDVALLYQPMRAQLLQWHPVRVPSQKNGFRPTRDILYAQLRLFTNDTLHVIVCHLPSKAGGVLNADAHRHLAAGVLREVVDSVLNCHAESKVLVMGDFNASQRESVFHPLMPPLHETLPTTRRALRRARGTYFYKGLWSYLDHILVSGAVVRWQPSSMQAEEFRLPSLLDAKGVPHRTYRGPVYNGGISDHLPLVLSLIL